MGSTGEPDRKRRHFTSILPTAGAAAKKHILAPCSDEKKLDVAVLQYQNRKLLQQLEAQKVENFIFEDKYNKFNQQREIYEDAVAVVNTSWEQLVSDLESRSISTCESTYTGLELQGSQMLEDGASTLIHDDFLSRIFETGATESCSHNEPTDHLEYDTLLTSEATNNILQNIIFSINSLWRASEDVVSVPRANLSEDGMQLLKSIADMRMEARSLISGVNDLHLKHRVLTNHSQRHRDMNVKLKADQKYLAGELSITLSELEESNFKLASLKAQRDGSNVAPILKSTLGNKQSAVDTDKYGQKEIQDMESSLNEFKVLITSRIAEISDLHEGRIEILKKLVNLQNTLVDVKSISSSRAFLMLKEQLDKSKAEMDQCRISLEKLQVEKDTVFWNEKELTMEVDVADISGRICELSKSRIAELEQELQKFIQYHIPMETKLEASLREPGRKEIIAEFKELVSSLPKEMDAMQSELGKLKESSSEIHCLRAHVLSFSGLLQWEVNKLQSLFDKFASQLLEIKKLHLVVGDLRESIQQLKLILEMYRRESTDPWDVLEFRDVEYKAWAQVQNLNSVLDEHNLESRVKASIEAEAMSQQRLAIAEAEIVDLRQNLDLSARHILKSSEMLKSKNEEGEAYLSEIESIGQAYEDMQTQNQQLLQEITERDDYNIKLVMEGVKARQLHDVICREIQTMDKKLQEFDTLMHLYDQKAARFDEQLKVGSDQVVKLAEDGWQSSVTLGAAQRRLSDVHTESQELRHSLGEVQILAERSRLEVTELLIELERERFKKKRLDEGTETMTIKVTSLRTQTEGSVILEKLQQEMREFRGILKCCICHERQKEVAITKCYHLFCGQCVQRIVESRHRKCPTCSASFGPNDVKPIYI
ncbi:E3 ubiquitin-protein ligase BRE1-like 1 [Platanthera guangdongensis]|uniref:E3 ubiquitin protein ligase n=1 Tax=Platanthera guangdongensis TaxID=2320717 RepID=A0ABR2MIQ0_9ASPA